MATPKPRSYVVSSSVAFAAVAALALFSLSFFYYALRIDWTVGMWQDFRSVSGWNFNYISEMAGHFTIMCIGILTPFLELFTWVRLPTSVTNLAARCGRVLCRRQNNAGQQHSKAGAGSNVDADVLQAPMSSCSNRSWRGRLAVLGITSISATIFLAIWLVLNVLWCILPFADRYLWLVDKDNTTLDTITHGTLGTRVILGLGYKAGIPAMYNFALVFIPVDRSSSWLTAFNMSYEEGNLIHRLVGYAAFLWTVVHVVFLETVAMVHGKKAWYDEYWNFSSWYSYPVDLGLAQIGMGFFIIVVITSLGWMRKRFYNIFRLTHLLLIPVVPLMIIHIYWFHYVFTYGIMLYMADLAQRIVMNSSGATAMLTMVADESDKVTEVRIQLKARHMRPDASWASQVIYLRFPSISLWECHPYSITAVEGDTVILHIAGSGNWTQKVHNLALSSYGAAVSVPIYIEGPYGGDSDHATSSADSVVLLAAGIGITPVVALAKRMAHVARLRTVCTAKGDACGSPSVHLWWIIRHASMAASLPAGMLQRLAATAGFHVRLFVTAPGEDLDAAAAALSASAAARGEGMDTPKLAAAHIDSQRSSDSVADSDTGTNSQPTPFQAFLRRFIPRMLITWTAALMMMAGYVIACQMMYSTYQLWYEELPPRGVEYARLYNATTFENYYRSLQVPPLGPNDPLPSGAPGAIAALQAEGTWPEGQPEFAAVADQVIKEYRAGLEPYYCITCSETNVYEDYYMAPSKFRYGMGPFNCCGTGIHIGATFLRVLFPPVLAFLLCALVAWACRTALARYWPLHRNHNGGGGLAATTINVYDRSPSSSIDGKPPADLGSANAMAVKAAAGVAGGAGGGSGVVEWQAGRPNLPAELQAVEVTMRNPEGITPVMRVYCCAPPSLRESVRDALFGKLFCGGGVVDGHVRVLLNEFHVRD